MTSEVREMKETTNNRRSRAHNPFDDGARERLRRMGLLTETGSIKASALTALAHTFAGLLFDDLCDASQDYSGVQTELQQLFDAVDCAEPRQKFLLLCLHMTAYPKSCLIPFGGSAGHLRSRANLQNTLSGT